MQASVRVADTCSGTFQFYPELAVPVEGGATALAIVDIPFKPQHVPSHCDFNLQYERVSTTYPPWTVQSIFERDNEL